MRSNNLQNESTVRKRILLLIILLFPLFGCHKDWTSKETGAFIDACEAKGEPVLFCTCAEDLYEKRYSNEEIEAIVQQIHDGVSNQEYVAFMHATEDSCQALQHEVDGLAK